jgi:hypothetical protein
MLPTIASPIRFLNPLAPLQQNRPASSRPPILCRGLLRSGTESLIKALSIVGFGPVYHGFTLPWRPEDCVRWAALLEAKVQTLKHGWEQRKSSEAQHEIDRKLLKNFDYYVILRNVGVLSDIPVVLFWDELLATTPTRLSLSMTVS